MNDAMKKLLKISGTLCLAYAAAVGAYATTRYLSRVAWNRKEPESFKMAGKALSRTEPSSAFLEELQKSAEVLSKKDNETVQITSKDGIMLVGHWIPCQNAKRVCHARLAFIVVQRFWDGV